MGRTATLTPQVEIESCPDYPHVFPFWIWRETTATSVPASLCHSSRRRPENFHSNMTLVRDERRKAVCIIFLNQMSPRHTSGILYEYPQVTTCFRLFLLKRSQTVTRSWLPAHRSFNPEMLSLSVIFYNQELDHSKSLSLLHLRCLPFVCIIVQSLQF